MKKAEEKLLVEMAKRVRENAYSPYFKVHVGAALMAEDGSIHVGCNMENASGSAIVCAESNALAGGIAKGYRKFTAVAVVAFPKEFAYPCGVCRQKLAEFCDDNTDIILGTVQGKIRRYKLIDLFPHPFRL
jgi:cytidine deaminase